MTIAKWKINKNIFKFGVYTQDMKLQDVYDMFAQNRSFDYEEFFTTQNVKRELEKRLQRAEFKQCEDDASVNYTDGVYLQIRDDFKIPATNLVGETSEWDGVGCCFVMELNKPLDQFQKDHALFKFFKELYQPKAYGYGQKPKYSIKEFLDK